MTYYGKSFDVSFKIHGLKEVLDQLRNVQPRQCNNAVRAGLRAGSGVIRDAARQKVPIDDGDLRRAIQTVARRGKKGVHRFQVGIRRIIKRRVKGKSEERTVRHGHLIEFGTGPRYHEKSGKYVGATPAQPFMRPALNEMQDVVIYAVVTKVRSYVNSRIRS